MSNWFCHVHRRRKNAQVRRVKGWYLSIKNTWNFQERIARDYM